MRGHGMYLGMLILGWLGGLAMGATAVFGLGLPVWAGFLVWSFGASALVLVGCAARYLRRCPTTQTPRTAVRAS